MTIKEAQQLIAKDIEKAQQDALLEINSAFPVAEWEKYVPEKLRDEAQNFTVQEKREILMAAKARFAPAPEKPPDIPQYIEVPKTKDWSSFGSMVVPGNGEPNPAGAVEMEQRINPRWVEMQKQTDSAPLAPPPYSSAIDNPFMHVMNIGHVVSEKYNVKHFQQLTPDTITITFALKG